MMRSVKPRSYGYPLRPSRSYRPDLEILEDRLVPSFAAGQFVAKMYTEALGRAPLPPADNGWQTYTNYIATNGCTTQSNGLYTTLDAVARGFFKSAEYGGLYGSDSAAKVITLYRALLNREPDSGGFPVWKNQLDVGTDIGTIVDSFLN